MLVPLVLSLVLNVSVPVDYFYEEPKSFYSYTKPINRAERRKYKIKKLR